ncbi:Pisatin demethylase [Escovopsis weberi]|uniref:Pisatin demethylase n=1 Tax=Escovopsis weberi TaxID=150374 RepID=A0A0N0RTT6_ESCWE|nr:Pisatin demethylase [Escovopsis weberi]
MPKSDWYSAFKHPDPNRWSLFSDTNIARHTQQRRVFQNLYSMSSLVSYESYVDECADLLQGHLSQAARRREGVDMMHWFQCYAYDVIGNMTFSKRLGFLDRGDDVGGLLQAGNGALVYSVLVGIYASWHPFLHKLSCWFRLGGARMRDQLATFVGEQIGKRKKASQEDKPTPSGPATAEDFLQKLMNKASSEGSTKVTDYHLFALGLSNITAGSDTTAASLSGILYLLLKNPAAMEKMRAEVDGAATDGRFSDGHLAFKDSLQMPYLQAVIKEAMRVYSVTGLPMWRVVPAGGVEIGGTFFPEGSHLGINPCGRR